MPPFLIARVKKEKHSTQQTSAISFCLSRSLVNNERRDVLLLCESSAGETRARRAGRSQHTTYFFGLRRAELACLRRFSSACGAFRSACGAKRTRPKSQACGSSAFTHLLAHAAWIGFASKWQQANPPVVVQQHASLLFRSLLIPAGCNSYGSVVLCMK